MPKDKWCYLNTIRAEEVVLLVDIILDVQNWIDWKNIVTRS